MSGYTPGPWFEHREGFSTVYVEAKLRDGVIQEVAACGPTEAGSDEQAANARLIAAAPELLEALQEFVDLFPDVIDGDAIMPALDKGMAALAKALGQQQEV